MASGTKLNSVGVMGTPYERSMLLRFGLASNVTYKKKKNWENADGRFLVTIKRGERAEVLGDHDGGSDGAKYCGCSTFGGRPHDRTVRGKRGPQ